MTDPDTPCPIQYRGIQITRPDVPGAPWTWVHCETDGHGEAATVEEARAQIDAHWAAEGGAA